jgi:hypothetical protein
MSQGIPNTSNPQIGLVVACEYLGLGSRRLGEG